MSEDDNVLATDADMEASLRFAQKVANTFEISIRELNHCHSLAHCYLRLWREREEMLSAARDST